MQKHVNLVDLVKSFQTSLLFTCKVWLRYSRVPPGADAAWVLRKADADNVEAVRPLALGAGRAAAWQAAHATARIPRAPRRRRDVVSRVESATPHVSARSELQS